MKHTCHWPGCPVEVRPAVWGCKKHWMSLPKRLRDPIWANFRPGQEHDKRPSPEYIAAAQEIQRWIAAFQASQRGQGHSPMRNEHLKPAPYGPAGPREKAVSTRSPDADTGERATQREDASALSSRLQV